MTKKKLIVGVDPGTRVGIAIMNLKGKIIFLHSKRGMLKSELIDHIYRHGKPLLIASDVNPLPKAIERLAKDLKCEVFFPEVQVPYSKKLGLVRRYKDLIKDSHQRDALAAALMAYKSYQELFQKIRDALRKVRKPDLFEEVVIEVLTGRADNIRAAVARKLKEVY